MHTYIYKYMYIFRYLALFFYGNIGLICRNSRHFCGYTGLFGGDIGLFFGYVQRSFEEFNVAFWR